jgi:hypothetical protein
VTNIIVKDFHADACPLEQLGDCIDYLARFIDFIEDAFRAAHQLPMSTANYDFHS